MIPRLWVCTSHPILQLLAAPLHPLFILMLVVAVAFAQRRSKRGAALVSRRVLHGLLLSLVGGLLSVSIAGSAVHALGANPNPIYVAARYIWPILGWSAVAAGTAWGLLDRLRLEAQETTMLQVRPFATRQVALAAVPFLFVGARLLIPDASTPWSIPYKICDYLFDAATTDLASDECLAMRAVDDGNASWPLDPRWAAGNRLNRRGQSAVPGVVAFLQDQLPKPGALHIGLPDGTGGLLAFVARYGDSPILSAYDEYPYFHSADMRACVRAGHRVVPGPRPKPNCVP